MSGSASPRDHTIEPRQAPIDQGGVAELVERVARAIATNKRAPEQRTAEIIDKAWPAYCGQARAAIEAVFAKTEQRS